MKSNLRIARALIGMARELVGADRKNHPVFEVGKEYDGFSGRFQHPANQRFCGWVANASFVVNKAGILWKNGIWKQGNWIDGVWLKGTWKNGTWEIGDWYNGTWENGVWKDGVWNNGTWLGGTWAGGQWKKGYEDRDRNIFHGSKDSPNNWLKFKSQNGVANQFGKEYVNFTGIVNYGTGGNGDSLNGKVENASFVMDDFTRKNFTWHGGTWRNGRFEHGVWEDGTWLGGFFNSANSTWMGGLDKDGNRHEKDDSPDKWKNLKEWTMWVYRIEDGKETFLFDVKTRKGNSAMENMDLMEASLKQRGIKIPDDCDYYADGYDIVVRDDGGRIHYRMTGAKRK